MEPPESNIANPTTDEHMILESQSICHSSTPVAISETVATDVNLNDKPSTHPSSNLDTGLLLPTPTTATRDARRSDDVNDDVDGSNDRPEVELFAVQFLADVIDQATGVPSDVHDIDDDDRNRRPDIGFEYFRYRRALLDAVGEIAQRHRVEFNGMISRLFADIESRQRVRREDVPGLVQSMLDAVVREMLADGQCNWGRVATVYAFASALGRRWVDYEVPAECDPKVVDGRMRQEGVINDLKVAMGRVIVGRLATWISANGGLKELDRFFKTRNPPFSSASGILSWQSLLVVTAAVGAVAVVVFTLAHRQQ